MSGSSGDEIRLLEGFPLLITRTPLRISIGGGGTDLPSYYSEFGGFVISAAITKYIFLAMSRKWEPGYTVKYSSVENVERIEQLQHPIFKEVLARHTTQDHLELASFADVPAGTGLGSSGSFTVGLLKAAYAARGEEVDAQDLAEEACEIEIDVLRQPVGKQDQYIAAFGGLQTFEFHPDGAVSVSPLDIPESALKELEERLVMFFTGYARQAAAVLSDQRTRSVAGDSRMLDNLHFTKQLGLASRAALEEGRLDCYAEILREHWNHKKTRSPGTSNERINRWHDLGMENGAVGGKLVGAGGGGFLLFLAEDPARLRSVMAEQGLHELQFRFDRVGSTVIVEEQHSCSA